MSRRPWQPAPPDPGVRDGGIRNRALAAVRARGRTFEDPARTEASRQYWAQVPAEQQAKAREVSSHDEKMTGTPADPVLGAVTHPEHFLFRDSFEGGELPDIFVIVVDVFSTELPF